MALDPSLALTSVGPVDLGSEEFASLRAEFDLRRGSPWAFRTDGDGYVTLQGERLAASDPGTEVDRVPGGLKRIIGERWLVCHPETRYEDFRDAVAKVQAEGGNVYVALESAAMLLLAPTGRATLTGGSFALSSLRAEPGSDLSVEKLIHKEQRGSVDLADREQRIRNEASFLSLIKKRSRFVPMRRVIDDANSVGYVADFVHGYTLAERLFHRSIGVGAAESIIAQSLTHLKEHIYSDKGLTFKLTSDSDYLRRIDRRERAIWASGPDVGRILKQVMSADVVEINGHPCRRSESMRILQMVPVGQRTWSPPPTEPIHGDLILDDIVVPGDYSEFRMIDPAGSLGSRRYDIGKLCLSLLTLYEFFKFNQFACDVEMIANTARVELRTLRPEVRDKYQRLASNLPRMLQETDLLAGQPLTGTDLQVMCGLQNLALPMFHLLAHGAEKRALAFYCIGLLQLEKGTVALRAGSENPLTKVCEEEILW